MYKLIIYLILFFSCTFAYSQKREDVYLKYVGGASDICLASIYNDGREKKDVDFIYKFHSGYFIICDVYLQLIANSQIGELTEEEVSKLNVVKIDYLLRKREKNKETQLGDPNKLFKIYVLVPSKSKYLKFEVKWKDIVPVN